MKSMKKLLEIGEDRVEEPPNYEPKHFAVCRYRICRYTYLQKC